MAGRQVSGKQSRMVRTAVCGWAVLLLVMAGCSTAPLADCLDCTCPGKFRPKAGARPFGGVCLPQSLPNATGGAVVPLVPSAPVVPGAPVVPPPVPLSPTSPVPPPAFPPGSIPPPPPL